MKIKRYCFFGSFLQTQENWLNRMAKNGYRLVQVGRLFLLLLGIIAKTYLAFIPAAIALFPVLLYQYQIEKAKKEARIKE